MLFMGNAIQAVAKQQLENNPFAKRLMKSKLFAKRRTGVGLKKKNKKSLIKKDETKAIKKPVQQKKVQSVSLK